MNAEHESRKTSFVIQIEICETKKKDLETNNCQHPFGETKDSEKIKKIKWSRP